MPVTLKYALGVSGIHKLFFFFNYSDGLTWCVLRFRRINGDVIIFQLSNLGPSANLVHCSWTDLQCLMLLGSELWERERCPTALAAAPLVGHCLL